MVPGHEHASARLTPDGGLELRVGVHSHGQGLETTLAQIAHEVLGIETAKVSLVHGDTALTPYSTGTWGSRCAVMAGGAVATACRALAERAKQIGARLLQTDPDRVSIAGGRVIGPGGSVSLAEVARVWYRAPQNLPDDADPGGLEVTIGYKPLRDTGTFSYACHAALVAVDVEIGAVEILDYVVVEDGGKLINPMIVDGQVLGGIAQGVGTALYEEMPFDSEGQPLASTFADYLLPGSTDIAADPYRAHGDALTLHRIWAERDRRERCYRAARRHRQRRQRRPRGSRDRNRRAADHPATAVQRHRPGEGKGLGRGLIGRG